MKNNLKRILLVGAFTLGTLLNTDAEGKKELNPSYTDPVINVEEDQEFMLPYVDPNNLIRIIEGIYSEKIILL